MTNELELGKTYGNWTVLDFAPANKSRNKMVVVQCKCGEKRTKPVNKITGNAPHKGCSQCRPDRRELTPWEASARLVYGRYKNRAKANDKEFDLSIDEFKYLTSLDCFYCGRDSLQSNVTTAKNRAPFYYNGLDRIDSSKGYTIHNIATSCNKCNVAKSNMSFEEYIEWIMTISSHMNKKIKEVIYSE